MVIAKLKGGLGNQLFQYAAGRSLACRHNARLKLDISFLESDQKGVAARAYELKHLSISAEIAVPSEVAEITGVGKNIIETISMRFHQVTGTSKHHPNIFKERHFQFDPELLNAPDNTYLEGYWQSEKYFKDIEEIIRCEFTVKNTLASKNLDLAGMILKTNSVSIHVRRGDYVTVPITNEFHGLCGLGYYQRGIDEMLRKVVNPHFYVFSDDPEWVKENIKFPLPITYVNYNGSDKGYEDLRLMSLCKHHIIANSSFSWWGAWLCKNPEKIVIAPTEWFNKPDRNTDDLIPQEWIRL